MLPKIKQYQTIVVDYAQQLQDVRVLAMAVFVVIVLLVSWSGVKAIDTNYGLQKQISELQQENNVQQLTNDNMQLQNEYYNTPQYLELAARGSLGLAAPGETELIVPESVALAHTVNLANSDVAQSTKTKAKQPAYQRHFQEWVDFFLHRQSQS
jgi:cell division protein FtsB